MGFQSCKLCVNLLVFMYLFASTTCLSCYLTHKLHNIYMLSSLLVFWVVYVVCKIPVKSLVPTQSHFITLSVPHTFQVTDHLCFWSTHIIPIHLKTIGKIKRGRYLNFILLVIFLKKNQALLNLLTGVQGPRGKQLNVQHNWRFSPVI